MLKLDVCVVKSDLLFQSSRDALTCCIKAPWELNYNAVLGLLGHSNMLCLSSMCAR